MDNVVELWGTFSVADHLRPWPFVADVLLYDHLVVPVPTPDLRDHWRDRSWEPEKQERLLAELGDLAVQMPWTEVQRVQWEQRYSARPALVQAINGDLQHIRMVDPNSPANFVSRQILADYANQKLDDALFNRLKALVQLPNSKIEAVMAYDSTADLAHDLSLKVGSPGDEGTGPATPAAVFEWTIHAPQGAESDGIDLLRRAVRLARRTDFREHRNYFYSWLHNIGDLPAIDARGEFNRRLADYERIMRAQGWRTIARRATQVLLLAPGLLALVEPVSAAVAGTVVGVAGYVLGEHMPKPEPDERTRVAAMAHDIREEFGKR